MPDFWIYILHCENGSLYTGYTIDLIKRFAKHKNKQAAKYTKAFPPLYVAQAWPIYGNKAQAMKIECFIKKLSKELKNKIILDGTLLVNLWLESRHQDKTL